ncbi:MAG TPA: glutaredoxin family protein [Solirubrobacteraceae bacterium]|nr:glutaredoxin family protein [Solirubrobacteraceae bacterium]
MTTGAGTLPRLVIFSRSGCCLCDDARRVLQRVQSEHPFVLEERDIETDDALLKAYFERIPVVELDGEHLSDHFVDERALRERLQSR